MPFNFGFEKAKELFSGESDFKKEAHNFIRNWTIKRGRANNDNFEKWFEDFTQTEEWKTILDEAKEDKFDGYVRENEETTGFAYKNSKDARIPSGGGGGILGPMS